MQDKFKKGVNNLSDQDKVICVGDMIQWKGGNAHYVRRKDNGQVYLELYQSWHPVPFPGDHQMAERGWDNIRHFNYDLGKYTNQIYAVKATNESQLPDFYRLSVDDAHRVALENN
ncbi:MULTISPECIES: hypothetical protein [Virgibacillus]|uniref:Uncharacterized protein n=1 Tax=Virgibacillus massiliensis TaxID=1462526 RepID=A0A024Q7W9_9BACI|nr:MULTISPECIES: hypothetical protein [Virgibacillus]EQB38494.1 hypothetical protein M948_07880 [Virgibacillus sp. CM-4]MYL41200.1 hypothetical protein [Virgibacillus massiliensis]CDQ37996.1 hypothetical protein BN990_00263 [Virgibacillus massiliensis]